MKESNHQPCGWHGFRDRLCATHAILGANLGPYRVAQWDICKPLLARLTPGMLCLADRGFNGYAHWKAARDTGAHLL